MAYIPPHLREQENKQRDQSEHKPQYQSNGYHKQHYHNNNNGYRQHSHQGGYHHNGYNQSYGNHHHSNNNSNFSRQPQNQGNNNSYGNSTGKTTVMQELSSSADAPAKPTFVKRTNTQSQYYPKQTHTPQPSKSPSSFYKQSSTPSFSKQHRPLIKDRWYDYEDSRNDPQRESKRKIWLEKTKEEREKLRDISQEYEKLDIEVTGEDIPKGKLETFYDIDLGQELDENILKAGFYQPMPVQKVTIPIVLSGRDLMSCAQTGSGKTAAFLFPIISNILKNPPIPRQKQMTSRVTIFPVALILSPTRELGQQIYEEAIKFSENTPIRSVCVYGGQEPYQQIQEMGKGCDILVATPGRLIHFLERHIVSLSSIRYLVLDEADRMLDMGFEPQIREICNDPEMPEIGERQTLMFSATFPKQIQKLAQDFLDDYIFITIGRTGSTSDTIEQKIIWVEEELKGQAVIDVLDEYAESGLKKGVIFVETKRGADMLEHHLYKFGYKVDSIHGDRSQNDRDYSLKRFKENIIQLLVATDVASRGLDIPDIEFVINYDMPKDIESYVHRIGRTGRAGKKGISMSFLNKNTQGMIPQLVPLLEESGQDIPYWFDDIMYEMHQEKLAKRREKSGYKSGRGGSRFGGRDRRYDRRGEDSGDIWDGNRSMSTPVRAQMFD